MANTERNSLISNGATSFECDRYNYYINKYDEYIDEWEKEIKNDKNNYLIDEEKKLWKRMKYENKNMDENYRGDRDEILYFLQDFKISSTNNQAEVDQRSAKIKQKIGKWRSEEGAEDYAIIKSCINTYKKNRINVLDALIKAFAELIRLVCPVPP